MINAVSSRRRGLGGLQGLGLASHPYSPACLEVWNSPRLISSVLNKRGAPKRAENDLFPRRSTGKRSLPLVVLTENAPHKRRGPRRGRRRGPLLRCGSAEFYGTNLPHHTPNIRGCVSPSVARENRGSTPPAPLTSLRFKDLHQLSTVAKRPLSDSASVGWVKIASRRTV
jgi:hypothetical protein